MIKGVNKKIIEINNPESPYFDKVVLYIKPTKEIHTRNELSTEVDRYLKSLVVKGRGINSRVNGKNLLPIILGMAILLVILITIFLI